MILEEHATGQTSEVEVAIPRRKRLMEQVTKVKEGPRSLRARS